jgi:hypothetical protein
MSELSLAPQAYRKQLEAIEAEKQAALNALGANAERLNIIALRRMSTALQTLRDAQLKASR